MVVNCKFDFLSCSKFGNPQIKNFVSEKLFKELFRGKNLLRNSVKMSRSRHSGKVENRSWILVVLYL